MKTFNTIAAIAVLAASTSANAWWGPFDNDNGYNNNNNYRGNGDGYGYSDGSGAGDVDGDFDSSFSFNMNAKARGQGRGNGSGYNGYRGYNGYQNAYQNGYGPYGYAPAPVLTEEQMKAQQAAFEKAQKEAYERHVEMMKNYQQQPAPAFAAPATFQVPAEIEARRAEMRKIMDERRADSEKRHQEFMKRMNEARTTETAPAAEAKAEKS